MVRVYVPYDHFFNDERTHKPCIHHTNRDHYLFFVPQFTFFGGVNTQKMSFGFTENGDRKNRFQNFSTYFFWFFITHQKKKDTNFMTLFMMWQLYNNFRSLFNYYCSYLILLYYYWYQF